MVKSRAVPEPNKRAFGKDEVLVNFRPVFLRQLFNFPVIFRLISKRSVSSDSAVRSIPGSIVADTVTKTFRQSFSKIPISRYWTGVKPV